MGNSRSFGNIRKLPSGRYQVRYRHLGRLIPGQTTYATKAEAKIYLAAIETDLNRGTYVDPDHRARHASRTTRRSGSTSVNSDRELGRPTSPKSSTFSRRSATPN